jgi:hypothetical protein
MNAHSVPSRAGRPAATRFQALIVLAIPLALCVAAYFAAISRLPITGDEPHYLIMAESVATDFDLDLRNNYEDEAQRPRIYGAVAPHVGKTDRGWMPFHAPGLSVLLALPSGLAGIPGARFAMIALAGALPWSLFRWLSGEMPAVTAVWLTLGVTIALPFCFGAQQIYPDFPAGAVVLGLTLWLLRRPRERTTRGAWAAWWLAIGLLPWLNLKFMATTAVLAVGGAAMAYRTSNAQSGPTARSVAATSLLAAVGPAAIVAFNLWSAGRPFGFRGADELSTSFARALVTFLGLQFDQSQGLFVQQPMMLAGLAALAPFARLRPRAALFWVALYASLIVPNSFEIAQYGGGGPAGRFGWSATWGWTIPLGLVVAHYHDRLHRYVKPAVVASAVYQIALAARWGPNPFLLLSRVDARLAARDSLFPIAVRPWLPSFYFPDISKHLRYAPDIAVVAMALLVIASGAAATIAWTPRIRRPL